MRRGLAFAALLALPLGVWGLDLTAEFGLSSLSGPRYAPTNLWASSTSLSLGFAVTDEIYVSTELSTTVTTDLQPRLDDTVTASWSPDGLSLGLQAGGRVFAGNKHAFLGAYISSALPLMGDLAELAASLQARTDLSGWYGELKVAPTVYLPLDKPLMLNLNVIGGFATTGFDGLATTGLTTLSVLPHVYLSAGKVLGFDLTAGYTFDLSGGALASSSGPAVAGKVSLSYGD